MTGAMMDRKHAAVLWGHLTMERPWGSKQAINRAGEALRNKSLSFEQAGALESWRIAHKQVINSFQALLRKRARGKKIEVAQRLKRRSTIVDKLSRYPRMELARMDDIAGCRLIFPNVAALVEFRAAVHGAKFKHIRRNEVDKYDYITSPTERGYRGIHDVYEYCARRASSPSTVCNGLLIELQYRTELQHAWATAVEVVTQLTENEPKFDRGDPRHIRLFRLASEILARVHEEKKSCLPALSDRQLADEFEALDAQIGVTDMLVNLAAVKWIDDQAKAKHVILQLSKGEGLRLHPFDLELEASAALLKLEKEFPEDDIVLVGAASVADLTSAFRNYFGDVGDFLHLMRSGRAELSGESPND
jgi:ppGpp synthetase/RelA/SpoT-type nucleotidyltranferase